MRFVQIKKDKVKNMFNLPNQIRIQTEFAKLVITDQSLELQNYVGCKMLKMKHIFITFGFNSF